MAFIDVFGPTLLTKDGGKPTEEVLEGATAVGIYFSAQWCSPCRGFTPKLSEWYEKSLKDKGMKIVFVSGDRDEESFKSYYSEQPWAALPYASRDLTAKLNKTYKVQGIPSFVILSESGEVITKDGREAVSNDPTGVKYPWFPPTPQEKAKVVFDSLGPELVQKASGKAIGLYFSAHWCPPCRGFTPKLAEFYNNGLKEKMEIIFVSSDRDESQFKDYSGEMPWLSLPYEKRNEKELLSDAFGVQGIPSFVVLNSDGSVITTEGRAKVMSDPKGDNFPSGWLPQPFNDVNDDPSPLNDEQCVIMLGGTDSVNEAVKTVANECYAASGRDIEKMPMRFFSAAEGSVTAQLRKLTQVEGAKLIILDLPSDGAFYVCDKAGDEISEAGVKEFIEQFRAGKLGRQQLSKL